MGLGSPEHVIQEREREAEAQGLPDLASHRLYSLGHTDQPDIMRERPIRLCETRMTGDSWSLAATA